MSEGERQVFAMKLYDNWQETDTTDSLEMYCYEQGRADTLKNMKCDRCSEGEFSFEQGKLEGWLIAIEEVIKLYEEFQPKLATNVYEFGERLKQLKEQIQKGTEVSK